MAVVVTLWVIALLSLVAAAFATAARTETNLARNLAGDAKAEGFADAGVYRAVAALLDPDPARWPRVDGTAYSWRFGDGVVLISVQDEAGKIDLNSASDQLLEALFASVGVEPAPAKKLVDTVRDFSDPDNLHRGFGAEDSDYRAAGREDGAKDHAFESVAELQQVLGVTPDLYERVAPVLTVYSGGRSIDPTTAPREALLALPGAKLEQVEAILTSRGAAGDSTSGELPSFDGLSATDMHEDTARIVRSRGRSVFTITAVARAPSGGKFERQAIVRLTGDPLQPFLFHEWHRAWSPVGSPG
jgi:general secretion pathway protein K